MSALLVILSWHRLDCARRWERCLWVRLRSRFVDEAVYLDSTPENLVPELALEAEPVLGDRWNGWAPACDR